jgi:DNA polymerase
MELDGVSKESVEEALAYNMPDSLRELLLLRLEHGRSSIAKFKRVIDSRCDDGRIRNHLIYHGASTGRWTSQTVQFQNLPRGGDIDQRTCTRIIKYGDPNFMALLYSNPVSALSTCIRGVVVAPKGRTLLVADYASIEARVLMWVAGQKDAVKLFKEGKDIYVVMARRIYNDPALTKKNKDERQLGKQAVLGCGYQMGWGRFKVTCQGYGMNVDDQLAQLTVKSYRETYKKVVSFWSDVEEAAKFTVRSGRAHHCGPVTFYMKNKFLYCRLPSGRSLAYYYPNIDEKEFKWTNEKGEVKKQMKESLYYFTVDAETKDFKKTYTYGGKLTENIVQAIARDIMAEAMLKLEEYNMPVVLSVHDEIVCEVYKDDAQDDLNCMLKIMTTLPSWAKGCPIDAEGWKGNRYRK